MFVIAKVHKFFQLLPFFSNYSIKCKIDDIFNIS